jgi:hypothetical protein
MRRFLLVRKENGFFLRGNAHHSAKKGISPIKMC